MLGTLGRGVKVFAGDALAGAEARFWITCSFFLSAVRRARMLVTTAQLLARICAK